MARKLHYTYEQYLELERRGDVRCEYLGGEIYAMAGGTPEHAFLAAQAIIVLSRVIPAGCRVASADLKVSVQTTGLYTYPDLSIICGPVVGDTRDANAATNPRWLVEVTSDSTEDYDRGAKLNHYQTLASLEAVVFISHRAKHLTVVRRSGSGWTTAELEPGASADLGSGVLVAVEAFYEGITLR